MERMSVKRVYAVVLGLASCGFWRYAKTFRLKEVGEMSDVLADRERKADVPVVKGNEQQSDAMVEMFTRTERRPSGGVTDLGIVEL